MSKNENWYQRDLEARRDRLANERARMAETGMSPYDEMTKQVEEETGTDSRTWAVLDERWERVTWLTRDMLHLPQDFVKPEVRMQHGSPVCPHGHDMTDPKNVYWYTRKDGSTYRKCRACARTQSIHQREQAALRRQLEANEMEQAA